MMARDNIAGIKKSGIIKNIFLFPGKVWQWIMYMSIGSVKGYGGVRQQTRLARSPLMTYVYSLIFWLIIGGILAETLYTKGYTSWSPMSEIIFPFLDAILG